MYAVFVYSLVLQIVFSLALISLLTGKPVPSKNTFVISLSIGAMHIIFAAVYAPHLVDLQQIAAILGVLLMAYVAIKLQQL